MLAYPTKSTLTIVGTQGNLSSFPGAITRARINKYYSVLEPSVKVHLTQERKSIQSTNLQLCSKPDDISPSSASNDTFSQDYSLLPISYLPHVNSDPEFFMGTPLAVLLLLPSVATIIF